MRYALAQIEDIHKLLHKAPITEIQDYVRSTYVGRSILDQKGAIAILAHVAANKSVYTSFWMGGEFAVHGLLQGPIPAAAKMEGLIQCLVRNLGV